MEEKKDEFAKLGKNGVSNSHVGACARAHARATAFVTIYVSYLHLEELVAHYQRFVVKILS